jgi:hypothetical protein
LPFFDLTEVGDGKFNDHFAGLMQILA